MTDSRLRPEDARLTRAPPFSCRFAAACLPACLPQEELVNLFAQAERQGRVEECAKAYEASDLSAVRVGAKGGRLCVLAHARGLCRA